MICVVSVFKTPLKNEIDADQKANVNLTLKTCTAFFALVPMRRKTTDKSGKAQQADAADREAAAADS